MASDKPQLKLFKGEPEPPPVYVSPSSKGCSKPPASTLHGAAPSRLKTSPSSSQPELPRLQIAPYIDPSMLDISALDLYNLNILSDASSSVPRSPKSKVVKSLFDPDDDEVISPVKRRSSSKPLCFSDDSESSDSDSSFSCLSCSSSCCEFSSLPQSTPSNASVEITVVNPNTSPLDDLKPTSLPPDIELIKIIKTKTKKPKLDPILASLGNSYRTN